MNEYMYLTCFQLNQKKTNNAKNATQKLLKSYLRKNESQDYNIPDL